MIKCIHCGNNNPDDNNFCDQCGQPLVKVMTEDVDSTEYANNPFKSNDSSTTQTNTSQQRPKKKAVSKEEQKAQPKKTIKKCSNCDGSGSIKEEVSSLFGKSYKLTPCPKCRGAGKYYVDENGKFVGVLKKTLNSDWYATQRKNSSNLSTSQIALIVCAVIIILCVLSLGLNSNRKTETPTGAQNNTDVSTGPTLDTEVASYTYRELYFEIPKSWESKQISGAEMYFEDPEEGYCIAGEQGDKSSDFEFTKLMIKSNYNEQLQNGECTSVDYEDCTFAGLDAYKVTLVQNNATQYIYAFNSDSGLYLICLLCPSGKEADFQPIMDYILDSAMLVNPDDVEATIVNTETISTEVTEESTTVTTEETTESTTETTTEPTEDTMSDIEYVSIPFYDLITFELPSDWICTDMGDDADWFYFEDPDGLGAWFFIEYCWNFDSCKDYSCTVYLDSIDDGLFSDIEQYNYIYTNVEGYTTAYYSYKTYNDDGVKIWVKGYMINTEDKVVHIRYAFPFDEMTTWGPIFNHISESFDVTD